MIEKVDGKRFLICDICCEDGIEFRTFEDAIKYKREEGWISQRHGDSWQDVCPDCQKEAD